MNADDGILALHAEQHDIVEDNEDMVSVYEGDKNEETGQDNEVKEPEVQKSTKEVNNFPYQLDLSKLNIFYSDLPMPEDFLKGVPEQVEYKHMTGTLEEIESKITIDILDRVPKLMIIQCFGKQLLHRSNLSVVDAIYRLIKLVDQQEIHQIAPSTNHFIPSKPGSWEHVAHFNSDMRVANIDRSLPPLTLHKALMDREFGDYGPLIIKGSMWLEYVRGEGVGETLSKAGWRKLKHFVLKAFENHFVPMERKPSKRDIGNPQPAALELTIGYADNPTMMSFIQESGLLSQRNYRRYSAPPTNRFQAVDPPTPAFTREALGILVQPQSKSCSSIGQSVRHSSEKERPTTWYGQNISIAGEGAARKVSMPSNDSGVFDESFREERNFNENQLDRRSFDRQMTRKYVTYDELEIAYERLKMKQEDDEKYYKKKIDDLMMDKEDLKDDKDKMRREIERLSKEVDKLSEDNEALKLSEECHKSKLMLSEKQLEAKIENIKLKDERMELLEQQYNFVKELHNDMFPADDKDKKKKKKRNH